MLKAVVFPAPLGPMIPRISPASSVKCKSFTAWRPPNVLLMPFTTRKAILCSLGAASCRAQFLPCLSPQALTDRLDQPLGQEQDGQDQDEPVDDQVKPRELS